MHDLNRQFNLRRVNLPSDASIQPVHITSKAEAQLFRALLFSVMTKDDEERLNDPHYEENQRNVDLRYDRYQDEIQRHIIKDNFKLLCLNQVELGQIRLYSTCSCSAF
jgi:hypothetical protein